MDLVIRGGQLADGRVVDIGVSGGRISMIGEAGTLSGAAAQTLDAAGLVALPGVVDPHVHFTTLFGHEEAVVFQQESTAAAAGGVTTVGDYPLGVTGSLLADLRRIREVIATHSVVDVAVAYPILAKEQLGELDALYDEGVTTYKILRAYRPPDVYSFGGIDDSLLYRAMVKVADMRKRGKQALLKVHCENVDLFKVFKEDLQAEFPDLGRDAPLTDVTWAHCRPPIVEAESVASAIYLASVTECPIMIVHLSSALSLDPIMEAKRRGIAILVETTPLYLETNAYRTGAPGGPPWTRVQPSVKFAEDAAALWDAIKSGLIDVIGTDHAASPKSVYSGKAVWDHGASGRSLLGIGLAVMLDASRREGLSLTRLTELMSSAGAEALGVGDRKGRIELGHDADIVLCDMAMSKAIQVADLHSLADHTTFEGRTVTGWPVATILRGELVWRDGEVTGGPRGSFVGGH